MVLLAILTGVVLVLVVRRHIGALMTVLLLSWGLLAASTPLGATPSHWLGSLSLMLQHWL